MNEIEKLYKNAGIDFEARFYNCNHIGRKCPSNNPCDLCDYSIEKYIYPPFTAEKQIGLIKWLFNTIYLLCLSPLQNSEDFENDLAELINCLWQDLTEEDKQQIKEILE